MSKNPGPEGLTLNHPKEVLLLKEVMAVFSRRNLFEMPLPSSVIKYLDFIHLNPLESTTDLVKSKYLVTSSKGSRSLLEKMVITGLDFPFHTKPNNFDIALGTRFY